MRVPALPTGVAEDFDVTRHGILDHAQRVALRHAMLEIRPELSPAAIDTCRTLGEYFGLVEHVDVGADQDKQLTRGNYASRRIALRPLRPTDTAALYEASLDPRNAHRWRFRGRTPSPEMFQNQLYHSVFAQLGVAPIGSDQIVGLVSCYDENLAAGHAKLAFQRCGSGGEGGEMIEGIAVFINYVFDHWPFRKLYLELPEYNLGLFDGLTDTILRTEGVMKEFEYYNETLWDLHVMSLSRVDWEKFMDGWGLDDSRQARSS